MSAIPHIFVIGFNKTATNSIHQLFAAHGVPGIHWDAGRLGLSMLRNAVAGRRIFEGYDQNYRVFSDMYYRNSNFCFEGNTLFRQMHACYPRALFLYNTRPLESWIRSRLKHKSPINQEPLVSTYKRILNTDDEHVVIKYWRQTRLRFEEDIRSYFRQSTNYSELDITDPDFTAKLSGFTKMKLNPSHWRIYNKTPI